jgi:hypothetical protein
MGMMLAAENAIDGNPNTMAHTKMGRGHWWLASFADGPREVTEVRITNRADCCGDRLKDTKVYIGNHYCGQLPSVTANGEVYTVTCETPVTGPSVIIRQDTTYTALQLANVEVYGNDHCTHDESINPLGAHKCTTSSDCSGARTCSRWKWCQGESGCPAVAAPTPRATYLTELYAASRSCGSLDKENYGKDAKHATAESCAVDMKDAGFEYFAFRASEKCQGCVAGTHDARPDEMDFDSIYKITPNLPLTIQDPTDNRQCKYTCLPELPWDANHEKCFDPANIKRVDCHVSKFGFVDKVDFIGHDDSVETSTMTDISLNQNEAYVVKSVEFAPGDRITSVKVLNKEA